MKKKPIILSLTTLSDIEELFQAKIFNQTCKEYLFPLNLLFTALYLHLIAEFMDQPLQLHLEIL